MIKNILLYTINMKQCFLIIFLTFNIAKSKTDQYRKSFEYNFVELLNDARKSPKAMSEFIKQKYLPKFNPETLVYDKLVKTREGRDSVTDCIEYLKKLSPRNKLQIDQAQSAVAYKHSYFMASRQALSHYDEGMSTPKQLINTFGLIYGKVAQIVTRIDNRLGDQLSVVSFLLIDDGLKSRFNRKLLMSDLFNKIGFGFKFEKKWIYITIQVAEDFDCDILCENKAQKLFQETLTDEVQFFGMELSPSSQFLSFDESNNNLENLKEIDQKQDFCISKQPESENNCIKKLNGKCELCANEIRLKFGKCNNDENLDKCEPGCSHCNQVQSQNSPKMLKNCLICKPGFLRNQDNEDHKCYEYKNIMNDPETQIQFKSNIDNCLYHSYIDINNLTCYLCKYGYILREGNSRRCERIPLKIADDFANCRVLSSDIHVSSRNFTCRECLHDPSLTTNTGSLEELQITENFHRCRFKCKNMCKHKCKNSNDCKTRCKGYCKTKCHTILENLYQKKSAVYKKTGQLNKKNSGQNSKNHNLDNSMGTLNIVKNDETEDYTYQILDIVRGKIPPINKETEEVRSVDKKTNIIHTSGNSKIEILDKIEEK